MRFRGTYAGWLVVVVGEGGVQCADKLKMMSVSVWFGRGVREYRFGLPLVRRFELCGRG